MDTGYEGHKNAEVVMDGVGQSGLIVGDTEGVADNLGKIVMFLMAYTYHKYERISRRYTDHDLLAQPLKWALTFSIVLKTSVDSIEYSSPASSHLMMVRSHTWKMETAFPFITSLLFSALIVSWVLLWKES